jgi:hypothetical protein
MGVAGRMGVSPLINYLVSVDRSQARSSPLWCMTELAI